ncbi:hypothetical protein SAMN05216302_10546 [Nitrosomonas aestuarii]|uniref:Uncharacterized protein n=1 Tax=Nitrosomonas aestuarii TaxID=52441 RepID=A0A1I4GFU2_9PROT|nr:hypothetical protein [Nitrosomonas aestuarii]SFL28914.1 hypothetical protein SAMN05216302_10546 [Nitrosomonas aestuarii]
MLIIRDPTLTDNVDEPDIRSLAETRFSQILDGEPYDYDQHGYMIVVEAGDNIANLEKETGCPLQHSGDPDFMPYFEALEEHECCFEMLFILNDEGFAITIFIPKHAGIDDDLLKLCSKYAVPATVK